MSYLLKYQNVAERNLISGLKNLSKYSEFYNLEAGFYFCITNIVEQMNAFLYEQHIRTKNGIVVKVPQGRKK